MGSLTDKDQLTTVRAIAFARHAADQAVWDRLKYSLELESSERELQVHQVEIARVDASLRAIQKAMPQLG